MTLRGCLAGTASQLRRHADTNTDTDTSTNTSTTATTTTTTTTTTTADTTNTTNNTTHNSDDNDADKARQASAARRRASGLGAKTKSSLRVVLAREREPASGPTPPNLPSYHSMLHRLIADSIICYSILS